MTDGDTMRASIDGPLSPVPEQESPRTSTQVSEHHDEEVYLVTGGRDDPTRSRKKCNGYFLLGPKSGAMVPMIVSIAMIVLIAGTAYTCAL